MAFVFWIDKMRVEVWMKWGSEVSMFGGGKESVLGREKFKGVEVEVELLFVWELVKVMCGYVIEEEESERWWGGRGVR